MANLTVADVAVFILEASQGELSTMSELIKNRRRELDAERAEWNRQNIQIGDTVEILSGRISPAYLGGLRGVRFDPIEKRGDDSCCWVELPVRPRKNASRLRGIPWGSVKKVN